MTKKLRFLICFIIFTIIPINIIFPISEDFCPKLSGITGIITGEILKGLDTYQEYLDFMTILCDTQKEEIDKGVITELAEILEITPEKLKTLSPEILKKVKKSHLLGRLTFYK